MRGLPDDLFGAYGRRLFNLPAQVSLGLELGFSLSFAGSGFCEVRWLTYLHLLAGRGVVILLVVMV